ncbi:MAG: hypothetical protein LKF71_02450 [Oscillospiraceae bacterium]|nr:hypothetical protein [Oscillospiraceae bacterium]
MKNKFCRIGAWLLLPALFSGFFSGCAQQGTSASSAVVSSSESRPVSASQDWAKAQTSPFVPYPQTVTYTLGKMCGNNNSNMPVGDTYENNAYTRYLKKMLEYSE